MTNDKQASGTAIDSLIALWSMRPKPGTEHGIAWEQGARQGYAWRVEMAQAELKAMRERAEKAEEKVENLAVMIRRLAYFVGKYAPAGMKCKNQAVELLTLYGLRGNILRAEYTESQQQWEDE